MRLISIILITLGIHYFSIGQQTFEDIKHDTIRFEVQHNQYLENVELFKDKDIDSIDVKILKNPKMFGDIAAQLHGNKTMTYEKLKSYYLQVKNNTNVQHLRTFYTTLPYLKQTIVDSSSWEKDQVVIRRMIKNEEQLNTIEQYVHDYTDSSVTYIQLLSIIERDIQQQNPKELHELLEEYSIAHIDSLLKRSKEQQKPILLYFSGHNVINARKLEMTVMNKQNIINMLDQEFIFVQLMVDDRTKIPKEDHYYSDRLNRQITTTGAFNMDYQLKRFEMNRQPFLVALDGENQVLGTRKYQELKSTEEFELFLEVVLEQFNNL